MRTYPGLSRTTVVLAALCSMSVLSACQASGSATPPTVTTRSPATASTTPSTEPLPQADAWFESRRAGLSISHPSAWTITTGTGHWTDGLPAEAADTIAEGGDRASFLRVASQPLGTRSGPAWADAIAGDAAWEDTCAIESEPTVIGGADGRIVSHCPSSVVNGLAWTADRGYLIVGYEIHDIDWFKAVLASVELRPDLLE